MTRSIRIIAIAVIFLAFSVSSMSGLRVGEKLTYDVRIGIFSAGTQVVWISERIPMGDREVYHVISHIKTNPFFSIFYKLDNRVDSFIDAESLTLRKFVREINEGKFHRRDAGILDLEGGKGYITLGTRNETINIPAFVLDVTSLPCYLRNINLSVNQKIPLNIIMDRGVESYVAFVETREKVRTFVGRFEAFKIVENKKKIKVWVSDDSRRLPVKIVIGTNFGDIVGVLKKVE